jgi:hypothetical protein
VLSLFDAVIVADYALLVSFVICFYMVFRGVLVDILALFLYGFLIAFYSLLVVIIWAEKKFSL